MSAVTLERMGPGSLTFGSSSGAKDFSARCTNAEISPESKDTDEYFLSGDPVTDPDATFGTLTADFYQDYTLNGLVNWTWQNDGKIVPFTFIPSNAANTKITGKVKIKAVKVGGKPNKANTTTLTFTLVEAMPVFSAKG